MNHSNIHLLTEEIISEQYDTLYTFLGTTSALITDYSSVFLDYYLLNRPVAFTINDYEEYKRQNVVLYLKMLRVLWLGVLFVIHTIY